MFTLPINNLAGKEVGEVDLDEKVFDGKVNKSLLHQTTVMYLANKRQGTASTKTRANVSGGNSKPWRQKGTGKARVGSSRSPLWKKGGIVFGPHPRDYSYQLPQKMKKKALICSLNSRLNDNLVKILEELKVDSGKTKDFTKIIQALNLEKKTLFVCDNAQASVVRSSRNIKDVDLKRPEMINALDVLLHKNIIITKKALDGLTARLQKGE
ncbi:MAG: 50S ribosomal protein L4 [Candidatus Omnitrophica bacterium]|nr:50S ribosomal protein L4 [Candidatus Omnitrophota bacterium]